MTLEIAAAIRHLTGLYIEFNTLPNPSLTGLGELLMCNFQFALGLDNDIYIYMGSFHKHWSS